MDTVVSLSGWLVGLWPVVMRSVGVAWTAPGWGTAGLGWRVRLGLGGMLSVVVGASLGPRLVGAWPEGLGWVWFVGVGVVEVSVGAALGYSAALVVSAARQAGDLIGAQAGLSVASLLDPEGGEGATALGQLYGLMALGVFLALDGPLAVVDALAGSFEAVPAASGWRWPTAANAAVVFGHVGWALSLAVQAAAPAALAVALAGLAIGWMGRAAGGSVLGGMVWPVRSAVGVVVVWLGLGVAAVWMSGAWGEWLAMLRGRLF